METEQVITFDDIIDGALGQREAAAAKRWLSLRCPVQNFAPSTDKVVTEVHDNDTTVYFDSDEDSPSPQPPPQLAKKLNTNGDLPPTQQPRAEARSLPVPEGNAYGREAFVGHGDAIGTLSRRRARASKEEATTKSTTATEGALPASLKTSVAPSTTAGGAPCAGAGSGSRAVAPVARPLSRNMAPRRPVKPMAAPPERLPPGWSSEIMRVRRRGETQQETAYISPDGVFCEGWPFAALVMACDDADKPRGVDRGGDVGRAEDEAQNEDASVDNRQILKDLVLWVRRAGRTGRSAVHPADMAVRKGPLDRQVAMARRLTSLQRLRTILVPKERKARRSRYGEGGNARRRSHRLHSDDGEKQVVEGKKGSSKTKRHSSR
jgi:hypothetical protein